MLWLDIIVVLTLLGALIGYLLPAGTFVNLPARSQQAGALALTGLFWGVVIVVVLLILLDEDAREQAFQIGISEGIKELVKQILKLR